MKIKILFVITTFQKDGPGNYLKYIIKYMDREKFDIYACCLYNTGEIENELKNLGVSVFTFNMRYFLSLSIILKLRDLIGKIKPDIVNTILLRTDLYGRIAAIGKTKIIFSTILNQDDYRKKRNIKEKVLMSIDEYLSNQHTDKIFVEANEVKKYCLEYQNIDEDKYFVIPSLIDTNEIGSDIICTPFKRERIIIGTAGRLHEQKGQKYLIAAFNVLYKKYNNMVLYIYGKGELEESLKKSVIDYGIEDRVKFKGYSNDLYRSLSEMDIYVMPSMWEGGAPISVLSSMALGLPVISNRVGGIQEFIENLEEGILIDVTCEKEIVEKLIHAIEFMIDNKETSIKMGVSAKEKVNNRFSAEKVSKLYQEKCIEQYYLKSK